MTFAFKNGVQWFSLLSLGLLVPLAHGQLFTYPFAIPKFGVLLFILGFSLVLLSLFAPQIPSLRLAGPLRFWGVMLLFTTLFSIDKLSGLFGNFGYFGDSLAVFLILVPVFQYAQALTKEQKRLLLVSLVAGASVVALVGLKEYWQISEGFHLLNERISSTLGQPNQLAFYLLAVLPLVFGIGPFGSSREPLPRFLFVAALVLIFVALLLTFSRTAYLSLILFATIHFFRFGRFSLPALAKRLLQPLWRFLILIFLFVLSLWLLFPLVFKRVTSIRLAKDPQESGYLRLLEWQSATKIWLDAPFSRKLIGYGPSTIVYIYPQYRSPVWNQSAEWWQRTVRVRNHYLNLLNETGVLGLIAFLWLLKKPLQKYLAKSTTTWERAAAAALLLIGLQAWFYYFTLTIWVIFFILLGLLYHPPSSKITPNTTLLKWLKRLSYLILGFGLIFVDSRFIFADALANSGKINLINTAVGLNPFEATYQQFLSRKFRAQAEGFAKEKRAEETAASFATALFWSQKAWDLHPLDAGLIQTHQWNLYLAGVHVAKSYHIESREAAERITELAPFDPRSWDKLGLVYLDLKELDQAEDQFAKAIALKDDYVGAYLHLGETLKQQGRLKEALFVYARAAHLSQEPFVKAELEKAQKLQD